MPQPYRYPSLRTGTSQDLLSIVTGAAERSMAREGAVLPRKSEAQRWWLEAPFVALGAVVAGVVERMPAEWALRGLDRALSALAGPAPYPFDAASPVMGRARELARRVEKDAGRAPALLAVVSHPPVLGDLAHLNFQLVRHAVLAARAVRGRPCRPRLVVAIDPFALDTVPLYEEGLYAGVMGRYHLGFDRLAIGRNPISAWLLRRCAWSRMAHRLLALLAGGGEAGLVLAGGVPSTTRILYAVREWAGRQRRKGRCKARAGQSLARLRQSPAFSAFEASGLATAHEPERLAEAYLMGAAAGLMSDGRMPAAAERGSLTEETARAARDCLEAFGFTPEAADSALKELAEEIARETPYRARLFQVLAGRVLARGRPLVFLPIVHHIDGGLSIEEREAWAWMSGNGSRLRAEDASGRSFRGAPDDFAVAFGKENFR